MRKPLVFSLTLLAATALLLVGCNPILPSEGNKVKFKAHSKSQPATKTAYAGYDAASTGSSHEDIYWSKGDDIRIYSGNTAVVTPAFANYELVISNDKTRATLQNPAEAPNGLAWVTDPAQGNDDVTFYAVYPPSTQGSESGWFTMSIPSEQTFATPTGTDMTHAYMLAQNTLTRSQFNSEVSLEFYPAFTAFQINLKSKDDELTLKKFRIYSEDNHLAGDYYGKLKAVNTSEAENECFAFNTDKSLRMDFAYCSDNLQNEVFVEFPYYETETETQKNTKISPTSAVDFTLLALPYGIVNSTETYDTKPYLTNLWLEVTFLNEDGEEVKKKLALKQTTTNEDVTTTAFLKFASCKKYRINGLAVDGGSKWRLQVDDLSWDLIEKETTFSQNIQAQAFSIQNFTETVKPDGTVENHYYPEGTRDYQVRTLDMNKDYIDPETGEAISPYFEVTFKPMAPMGGYWQLIPESNGGLGTAAFQVVVWDEESAKGTPDLKGHIMNQPVTLRIICNVTDDQRTEDHAIIIKGLFSTSISFDENSTFSADSEIQDVHKDGSFSYWRFVIPAKQN